MAESEKRREAPREGQGNKQKAGPKELARRIEATATHELAAEQVAENLAQAALERELPEWECCPEDDFDELEPPDWPDDDDVEPAAPIFDTDVSEPSMWELPPAEPLPAAEVVLEIVLIEGRPRAINRLRQWVTDRDLEQDESPAAFGLRERVSLIDRVGRGLVKAFSGFFKARSREERILAFTTVSQESLSCDPSALSRLVSHSLIRLPWGEELLLSELFHGGAWYPIAPRALAWKAEDLISEWHARPVGRLSWKLVASMLTSYLRKHFPRWAQKKKNSSRPEVTYQTVANVCAQFGVRLER